VKASYYVSFSRLAVTGEINGQAVTGAAWMDHEWFTHQLESSQTGWDWFSVQLDNGGDLMRFQLRRRDGGIDPDSSGAYIDKQGRARHLRRGAAGAGADGGAQRSCVLGRGRHVFRLGERGRLSGDDWV
jgi:predicted secreted hydrolase